MVAHNAFASSVPVTIATSMVPVKVPNLMNSIDKAPIGSSKTVVVSRQTFTYGLSLSVSYFDFIFVKARRPSSSKSPSTPRWFEEVGDGAEAGCQQCY
jgi:hypothetical protein